MAIAAGLICALAGYRHAAAIRSEAQQLQRWSEIAGRLALLLEEATDSLPEIFLIAADADTEADHILAAISSDIQNNPLTSAEESFGKRCSECPQRDIILRMFSRLGRGSIQTRVDACRQSAEILACASAKAQTASDRDSKMWRTLGWTGGVCMTLMLI